MSAGGSDDRRLRADAGFTLFEALIAMALMGLILGALVAVTAQWLPGWNRGLLRVQRIEQVTIALDRLSEDLAAAQYISPVGLKNPPLFRGSATSIVFVRSALGPNQGGGLEFVQITETVDERGRALVRTRAPFTTLPNSDSWVTAIAFRDPVVLLRAPFHLTFSYAASDGLWRNNWNSRSALPAAVRFDVVDSGSGLAMSTAAKVQVDMEPPRPDVPPDTPRLEGDRVASEGGRG